MNNHNKHLKRDKKIYGNWSVESPDGILMFRCEFKKADWYLKRNLAEMVSERTVRLKFKPGGLGNHNKGYGLSEMSNLCVNCGSNEFLTRHHIVPNCYRKYFPEEIKSHNFHDVVAMCVNCHEAYERKADLLKKKFEEEYSAPIGGIISKSPDTTIAKWAKTLLEHKNKIPHERIRFMSDEIKKYLGREWNIEDLHRLSNISTISIIKTHGQMVIEQITDIESFIKTWRRHFLDNNALDYLPSNWSLENYITNDIRN